MERSSEGPSSSPGSVRRRPSTALPRWGIALIAGLAAIALALGVVLQVEVASIQSSESGLVSQQLFGRAVNVTTELVPGNASYGYYGTGAFPAPTGNGNPLVMRFAFLEESGPAVTFEFNVCSETLRCIINAGSLDIIPIEPQASESETVLEPATGYYLIELLNLPAYEDATPLVTFSVQVNVTLLGQLDYHA